MGEREDLVYQAKLAEQAERYDGKRQFEGRLGGSERDVFLLLLANVNGALLYEVAQC